jgi:2EXR family
MTISARISYILFGQRRQKHQKRQIGDSQKHNTMPTEFRLFSKLPAEVRLQIWEEYTRFPRLLHLKYKSKEKILTLANVQAIPVIPPIFHVCRECREVAKTSYHILILNPDIESKVYVNFRQDVVYFGYPFKDRGFQNHSGFEFFQNWQEGRGTNAKSIEKVAFWCEFYSMTTSSNWVPRGIIKLFTSLRELIFICFMEESGAAERAHPRADEYGFETIPVDRVLEGSALNKYAIYKCRKWMNWNFTETRQYSLMGPGSLPYIHEDIKDPRWRGSGSLGDWREPPPIGYIEDPKLIGKEGNWDNTTLRFVVDRNVFVRPGEAVPFVFEEVKYIKPENFSETNMRHYLGFSFEADQEVDKEIEELNK